MKLIKTLLMFVLISVISISCKETKKEEVNEEMESVEETVVVEEGDGAVEETVVVEEGDGGAEAVEVTEAAAPAKGVESSSVGLEETVVEGVMVEAMADTPVIYPGCEGSVEEIRACSRENFINHLKKNFKADRAADLGLKSGEHKLRALIKIDKTGKASVLKVQGPHKGLDKEIIRVIDLMPQMTAATEEGQPVSVSFILPLAFSIM
jgi:protein TonB